jgi:hypothetical protein
MRERLPRQSFPVTLVASVEDIVSPEERATIDEARGEARDLGETTDRFTARDRLIALGVIKPARVYGAQAGEGGASTSDDV